MFFALVGVWYDLPGAIRVDEPIYEWMHWMRVSREEYDELRADGFRVCMAWSCIERGWRS